MHRVCGPHFILINGSRIGIHRGTAAVPRGRPSRVSRSAGASCLSMSGFPGDWFMRLPFRLRRGAHRSRTAGRLWILIVETAAADCCQGFSAGSRTADFIFYFLSFLAPFNRILFYNLAACPPLAGWLINTVFFCEQPFDLALSLVLSFLFFFKFFWPGKKSAPAGFFSLAATNPSRTLCSCSVFSTVSGRDRFA